MPAHRPALLLCALGLGLGLAGPAPAQDGAGRRAQATLSLADSTEDPAALIRLAQAMLQAGRPREAAELLERAEARLLTRAELATEADRPAVGGAIGDLAAARESIGRRDSAGAGNMAASALRRLERGEAPSIVGRPAAPATTGAQSAPAPAWGGGAPKAAEPAAAPAPLPGIAPQNMPVGGSASPPVPLGQDVPAPREQPPPGFIPPASAKPAPMR